MPLLCSPYFCQHWMLSIFYNFCQYDEDFIFNLHLIWFISENDIFMFVTYCTSSLNYLFIAFASFCHWIFVCFSKIFICESSLYIMVNNLLSLKCGANNSFQTVYMLTMTCRKEKKTREKGKLYSQKIIWFLKAFLI